MTPARPARPTRKVPRLSLAQFTAGQSESSKQDFAQQLMAALSEFGFVVIADHGIPAETFFSRLPIGRKAVCTAR